MSTVTIAILLGLLSAIFSAISNILAKRILRFTTTRNYISLNFAVIVVLLLPFTPWFLEVKLSMGTFALLGLAASIDGLANYFYFKSFEVNDAVIATVFLSLSPLFALALVPFFSFDDTRFQFTDGIGVLFTLVGIIILNREVQTLSHNKKARPKVSLHIIYPLLTAFLFGTSVYIVKYIFETNSASPFGYYFIRAVIIGLIMLATLRPDFNWLSLSRLRLVIMRCAFVILQWMFLLYALQRENPAIVKAVGDTTPLFVIIFAFLFLNEKINSYRLFGAFSIITGLIFIGL